MATTMNLFNKICVNLLKVIVVVFLFISHSISQTPGLIYESATGAGAAVLDPNGDGFTSATTAGFTTDDQTQSEINYVSFPFGSVEPDSDLDNAPDCGYTDFVDAGDKDAAQRCLSGGYWKFRLRMGGTSPNAKSYSILIDTDGLFGNTGATADPHYTIYNPGFEIEIVLATKFGVYVYDVNTPNCSPVISYAGTTNYQKSVALTTKCSDADYFLDFFVTFSDVATAFSITSATSMRYAIVSNTGSNTSSICSPSSASDVAGSGSFTNLGTVLTSIYDAQGPCSPDGTGCLLTSNCPVITTTLTSGGTSVSGTSTEANGTTINLYKNGTSIGSTTVSAGAWSISGLTAFVAGDIITATATASGEYVSSAKCNTLTVSSATCTNAVTSVTVCNADKAVQGLATAGATIRLYNSLGVLQSPTGGTTWNAGTSTITATTLPSSLAPTTDNFLWKCNAAGASTSCGAGGGPCLADGSYYVTAQSDGQCESEALWFCNDLAGTTATPTISTTISSSTTSVSGTVPSPDDAVAVTVYLYKNSILVGTVSTSNGAWTISSLTFTGCDLVKAMAVRTAATEKCSSPYSTVQTVNSGTTTAPVILGTYCTTTTISTVSGISSEADGTTIQVYDNGVAVGSTTTVSSGAWSVTGLAISSGHTITAKATKSSNCSLISAASTGVIVYTQSTSTSLVVTTSPIVEQASTVSGTYTTNGSTVQLYLDGTAIGSPATVAGGAWSVTGLASYDLTVGGAVTASVTLAGGCSSATVSGGTVVCISPTTSLTVTPSSASLSPGNPVTGIQVQLSDAKIIYQWYLEDGVTATGNSVVGTGGTITMASGNLSSSTTLKLKAFKLPAGSCSAFLTATIPVTVTLPIELLSFSAMKIGRSNEIQWTTLSELNNDYFTVEKANESFNFEMFGIVNGAGNSTECINYFLMDYNVQNAINYYRLKQTDFDGEFKYSSTISIDNRNLEKEIISIVNILGEEVNENYRGVVLIHYSNGSTVKAIQ